MPPMRAMKMPGQSAHAEVLERDAEAVRAGAEVERVAERQHPG